MRAGELRTRLRRRWPTLAVAAVAGGVVLAVALVLFPYLSVNHDEGVYLQQAAMLLDGQLFLRPPVDGPFRPWFFVESDRGLYSKYSPVPPAVFAVGMALGEPRLSLAAVAAASAALVVTLGRWAFDRPTGLAAGGLLLTAPMFLMTSASFLPYATTFCLNLAFAAAYVRACRVRSVRWAAAAGLASGVAFFARPYTAVLFAAPFAVHSLWVLATERERAVRPYAALVAVGLAWVGVTLGYNAVVTGDPLLFPYQAFAPLDGLGFGQRRILNHEMVYTPARALESNAYVLWYLATRWGPLGALGTALAAVGVVLARSASERTAGASGGTTGTWLSDRQFRAVLVGLVVSVAVGNLYFWGNANLLATPTDPRDGLLASFGPFYHFALLLPLSVFGGHAVARAVRALRAVEGLSTTQRRAVAVAALAVSAPVVGGAAVAAFDQPVERNAAYTDNYEQAYAPFEPRPPDDAVVLLPPAYGPWMNHPFQPLRNDPGFDGRTVYALDRDAETTWAVLDTYPDRTPHRFRYRGTWTPDPADEIQSTLQSAERVRTDEFRARTTVGAPAGSTSATVAVDAGDEEARTTRSVDGESLAVDWRLTPSALAAGNATVPIDGPTDAELRVTVVGPQGGTVYYELEVLVRPRTGEIEVVWPPERQVCVGATVCDDAYVPDTDYPSFVDVETERRSG
jgi:hypothetical protein